MTKETKKTVWLMERRMRWKSHVRCEAGEKLEITSKAYLSLLVAFRRIVDVCCKRKLKNVIIAPVFFCTGFARSSGYSQSASLLAHNRITAPQFIRRSLHSSWYKQVPTHCLLLFARETGDLLDSVKLPPYFQPHFLWILMCIKCCSTLTCFISSVEMLFSCLSESMKLFL